MTIKTQPRANKINLKCKHIKEASLFMLYYNACTACIICCILGHIISSTSQCISSLAMQHGKNLLLYVTQPLQASAVMFFMLHPKRPAGSSRCVASTSMQSRTHQLGSEMGSRVEEIQSQLCYVLKTFLVDE